MLRLLTASALLGALAFSCSGDAPEAELGPVLRYKFAPEVEIRLASFEGLPDAETWMQLAVRGSDQFQGEAATPILALIRAPENAPLEGVTRALEELHLEMEDDNQPYLGVLLDSAPGNWEIPSQVDFLLSAQPYQGTYRVSRDDFPRLFIQMNSETRAAEIRWEPSGRVGNGHYGRPLEVAQSSWLTSEGWADLSDGLALWGLGESDLGVDVPVWFEGSVTVHEARSAWKQFFQADVRLLALQTFWISEDPPSDDPDE